MQMSKAPHINIFKFYLGKILGQRDSSEDTDLNPLQLYQQFPREKIGIELTKTELDEPKPYIPKVYSGCNFIKVNPSSEVCTLLIIALMLSFNPPTNEREIFEKAISWSSPNLMIFLNNLCSQGVKLVLCYASYTILPTLKEQ